MALASSVEDDIMDSRPAGGGIIIIVILAELVVGLRIKLGPGMYGIVAGKTDAWRGDGVDEDALLDNGRGSDGWPSKRISGGGKDADKLG